MVSLENDVTVSLGLDTIEFDADVKNVQTAVNDLEKEAKLTFRRIRREANQAVAMLNRLVSLTRNVMKAIGQSMDPLYETLLDSVVMTAQTLINMAVAYLYLPFVGWFVYAALTAAALGMAIGTRILILEGRAENRRQLEGMQGALGDVARMMEVAFR